MIGVCRPICCNLNVLAVVIVIKAWQFRCAVALSSSRATLVPTNYHEPDLLMHPPSSTPRMDVIDDAHRTCDEPTFAAMSRLHDGELPFLSSFLRHYRSLGATAFYLLNEVFEQHDEILAFLRASDVAGIRVTLRSYQKARIDFPTPSAVLKDSQLLTLMQETFVINVAIDEYWLLPKNMSLLSYVDALPGDCYYMHWLQVESDALVDCPHPPYIGHIGHRGRWMARKAKILDMRLTEPVLTQPSIVVGDSYQHNPDLVGTLVHFWGPNFRDVAMKAFSDADMQGASGYAALRSYVNHGRIPERLQLLAFLAIQREAMTGIDSCHPPDCWVVDSAVDLLQVDQGLQARLSAQILRVSETSLEAEESHLLAIYGRYKVYLRGLLESGVEPVGYPTDLTFMDIVKWLQEHDVAASAVNVTAVNSDE
eukprot:TRINITY_DN4667_c0_g1_i1.p1 TRINITY_DN4667_c0_g1~~TRINITY_DN4667_c0_g1_i1.p1  ORF type:complete len:445 (-),score=48.09 TRINITY_DN4667_c0_g1_i1:30-1301(-)